MITGQGRSQRSAPAGALAAAALGIALTSFSTAFAADFWFYEKPDAVSAAKPGDRRWLLREFDGMPYAEELRALRGGKGYARVSLVFSFPPAPALAEEYTQLARSWKESGVDGHFKFVGSLPTADEARLLEPACALGTAVVFITNSFPTAYEAANINLLKPCARVDFALNRYFRWEDTKELRRIPGIPLGLVNNYFPAYTHVDNLNLIDNPVALRVGRSLPDAYQVGLLNQLKRLTSLMLDLDLYPMPEQYELLGKIQGRVGLRWMNAAPRAEDLSAWARLRPYRVQIALDALSSSDAERALRALPGEVIIETFPIQ